jgi:hypothetical protein
MNEGFLRQKFVLLVLQFPYSADMFPDPILKGLIHALKELFHDPGLLILVGDFASFFLLIEASG